MFVVGLKRTSLEGHPQRPGIRFLHAPMLPSDIAAPRGPARYSSSARDQNRTPVRNTVFRDRDWVDKTALCKQIAIWPSCESFRVTVDGTAVFSNIYRKSLPSSPLKPAPLGPDPSCIFATEVSGREEFMFRKLRCHEDLAALTSQIDRVDRASPCQLQGAFRRSRNSSPYCDLSISGGIHQSKMPSPCTTGETRRITLSRAVICHVSAFSRTRTAEAKSCRKTQYRSAIYKSVSRSNRNCLFRATQVPNLATSLLTLWSRMGIIFLKIRTCGNVVVLNTI